MFTKTPSTTLSRLSGLFLCAAAASMAAMPSQAAPGQPQTPGGCGAELWNQFIPPSGTPIGFEVDFAGDQSAVIPPQVTGDIVTNAFFALSTLPGEPAANPTTVTYDPVAMVTRVNFSGGALPDPVPGNWPFAPYLGDYHFGINIGCDQAETSPPITFVSQHWIYDETTLTLPVVTATWDGTIKKKNIPNELWAAIFTETGDQSTGGWQFIAYVPPKNGGPVKIRITNGGEKPVKIGRTGYVLGIDPPHDKDCNKSPQCAANQKALDSLNDDAFPAPGEQGSPFKTVKAPRRALNPGESFTFKAE